MATCNTNKSNSNLTGSGCTPNNSTCKTGKETAVVAGCNESNSAVTCCDTSVIGPRTKRDAVRRQLHDYILLKLGAPAVEVELDEQNIDCAIDEAMDIFENYAPSEYFQYYTFLATPGKSVYTLPPELGIGVIRNVYYKEMSTFPTMVGELGSVPLDYFYGTGVGGTGIIDPNQPIFGNIGGWVAYSQYNQMFSRASSQIGGFEFIGDMSTFKLYPTPCAATMVAVHYIQKCKDFNCANQALREGSLAYAKQMLGEIRGKYLNIPGAQGGTQINGADMMQRATADIEKWEKNLVDKFSDLPYPTYG